MSLDILPFAHALVARQDLPIPAWLFAWAAAIVLIASFYALSALWREPRFEDQEFRPLRSGIWGVILSPVTHAVTGLVSLGLLTLAIYTGLSGTDAPDRNFSITFLFVTAWLGFPVLSVLFGNVFQAFSPWRAVGRITGWAFTTLVRQSPAHLKYPERLGRWPAAVGLVAFVWLEIVYGVSGGVSVGVIPHDAAVAALLYSAYTFAGMILFGTEKWSVNAETFSVFFGMFSELSIFEARDGRVGRRRFLAGAARWATVPGSLAMVVASIGTTSFDGAQEGLIKSPLISTINWIADQGAGPGRAIHLGDSLWMLIILAGVAAFYLAGVRGMGSVRNSPTFATLRQGFCHTLIPIAFAYLVAHYFSLFVFQEQAQFTYLLSDPLGTTTTDLFGTASSGIDYGVVSSNVIWYVQVGALVVGHVAGLTMAHDRALVYWGDRQQATRSQYWMLGVMVIFTFFGLYLLSSGNG